MHLISSGGHSPGIFRRRVLTHLLLNILHIALICTPTPTVSTTSENGLGPRTERRWFPLFENHQIEVLCVGKSQAREHFKRGRRDSALTTPPSPSAHTSPAKTSGSALSPCSCSSP